MAHEIDMSNGRANMAYVGQKPWHGLGQELTPGASIETWTKEAGLNYQVLKSVVKFEMDGLMEEFGDKYVLHRSDTGKPLSIVSKGYHVVQPGDVMQFFAELTQLAGFELETVGALSDGKRVWALAKVGDDANIIGQDKVRPYVMLATSYDCSLATVAKFTAIRVVCNNTLTMAVGKRGEGQTEKDSTKQIVRIPHSAKVNMRNVREQLGIAGDVFNQWVDDNRVLAEKPMKLEKAEKFALELVDTFTYAQVVGKDKVKKKPEISSTKPYQRIMELFHDDSQLIGSQLMQGQSYWRMLNTVTQYIDHERGRTDDGRMTSAWFGEGETIKNRAYDMLVTDNF